jgi:hypothetical protein
MIGDKIQEISRIKDPLPRKKYQFQSVVLNKYHIMV